MGKGKGKIAGRVFRVKKGEVLVDLKFRNRLKSLKIYRALKEAIPGKTRLVYKNKWARRLLVMSRVRRPW